jgi:hypothetical protein
VDNASGSPQTVTLSGTGANPGIGLGIAPGDSATETLEAGAKTAYSLAIGGAGMSGTASLTCTGAPTEATCSVPATVTFTAQTQTLFAASISTTARTTGALRSPRIEHLAWLWTTAVVAGFVLRPRTMRKRARNAASLLALIAIVLLTLLICSCGGTSTTPQSPNGTPAGTYNLTVTATMGSNSQSTSLTLIVQ